jgi:hypothetical protein
VASAVDSATTVPNSASPSPSAAGFKTAASAMTFPRGACDGIFVADNDDARVLLSDDDDVLVPDDHAACILSGDGDGSSTQNLCRHDAMSYTAGTGLRGGRVTRKVARLGRGLESMECFLVVYCSSRAREY